MLPADAERMKAKSGDGYPIDNGMVEMAFLREPCAQSRAYRRAYSRSKDGSERNCKFGGEREFVRVERTPPHEL